MAGNQGKSQRTNRLLECLGRGSEEINSYINWVGIRDKNEYGVTLKHVKLAGTADAVSRVLAEKTAGRTNNGSVDLIWINGENFANLFMTPNEFPKRRKAFRNC